jgi:ADP-heptose:LPS heptosyltransferase
VYPVATRNPWRLGALSLKLRRASFDAVVNLTEWRGELALKRDAAFFRACGIPRLIGFDIGPGEAAPADGEGRVERVAAGLLRRVASLGRADLDDPRWFGLDLSEEEMRRAAATLRQGGIPDTYLVFSVGTKLSVNDWGQENWRALLRLVGSRRREIGCVCIGAASEEARALECLAEWRGPTLNLCGRASPRQGGAVLAGARLFVGHDSGPMHLAASVGTPCVAIFSARNPPGKWFPLGGGHDVIYRRVNCMNCGLNECQAEGKKCILGITVTEVADAVLRRLQRTAEPAASVRLPG